MLTDDHRIWYAGSCNSVQYFCHNYRNLDQMHLLFLVLWLATIGAKCSLAPHCMILWQPNSLTVQSSRWCFQSTSLEVFLSVPCHQLIQWSVQHCLYQSIPCDSFVQKVTTFCDQWCHNCHFPVHSVWWHHLKFSLATVYLACSWHKNVKPYFKV